MRRTWLTSTAVAAAVVWGAVAPAGALTATAALKAKLLVVGQVPKGFLKEATSSIEVFGCSGSAFPVGATASASVSFNYGGPKGFPLITEEIGTFKTVTSAYAALAGGLAACTTVSGTAHGSTFTGTITKMSFKAFPDASAAYAVHVTLGSSVLYSDVLIVRHGNVLMDLQEGGFAAVSASAFRAIATAAVHKL
ncbi:MAG TPA: hypothetical protein VGS61_01090 [Acidimicrobiales bacterium]|nr:hypothetical protein [Acidimicrobiales bacterium]